MVPMTIYSIRPDGVFGGEVEIQVADPLMAPIPRGHTRESPHPIPEGCYAVMSNGWKYAQGQAPVYPDPVQAEAEQAAKVRAQRNDKLAASDWTQLSDSTADKAAWAAYRQALRDITAQASFPWTIDWPEQP
jgi:hypothetical protein